MDLLAPDKLPIDHLPRLFPPSQAPNRGEHDHPDLFAPYESQELVRWVQGDLVDGKVDIWIPEDLFVSRLNGIRREDVIKREE